MRNRGTRSFSQVPKALRKQNETDVQRERKALIWRRWYAAMLVSLLAFTGAVPAIAETLDPPVDPPSMFVDEPVDDGTSDPADTTPAPDPTETIPASDPTETIPAPDPTETTPAPTPTETSAEPVPTPTESEPASILSTLNDNVLGDIEFELEAMAGGTGLGTPPGSGEVLIRINYKGGDRTTADTVAPAPQGAVFGAYLASSVNQNTSSLTPVETCTTDAAGQCWMKVSTIGGGQGNSESGYLVKEITAPTGYRVLPELTGSSNGLSVGAVTPYAFYTGQVGSGRTEAQRTFQFPSSTHPSSATGSNLRVSSGVWANPRINPDVPGQCGINVGLLVDLSTSVSQATGGQTAVRNAAGAVINALTGTPSQIALHTFGTTSPAGGTALVQRPDGWVGDWPAHQANSNLGLQSVASATSYETTLLRAKAASLTAGSGGTQYTNWDDGLYQLNSLASDLDVVIMITDGMPTRYGNPASSTTATRFIEMENAIASANVLKDQDVKIIAVGVGAGASGNANRNLQAISGTVPNNDYYQVPTFGELAAAMKALADKNCEGTVNIVKQVLSVGGDFPDDAAPQAGWEFTATAPAATVRLDVAGSSYATSVTGQTGATGVLGLRSQFSGTTQADRRLTVTEDPGAQYTLRPWTVTDGAHTAGDNARCVTTDAPNTPLDVENVGTTGFRVDPVDGKAVSCAVVNQALDLSAQLRVDKIWQIDTNGDGTFEQITDANQAPTTIPGLSASLQLTDNVGLPGGTKSFGTLYANLAHNSTVGVAETVSGLPPLCTNTATFSPTLSDGKTTLSKTTAEGVNVVTITNTVTCETRLTLEKSVTGSGAPATDWNLDAIAPATALAGPNGSHGSAGATAPVTPGVVYPLAELATTDLAKTYTQQWRPTLQSEWSANHAAGATGSWVCVSATGLGAGGAPVWGANQYDGRNGGVTVGVGGWSKCTAVNDPNPTLQLVKKISVDGAETVVPVGDTRWTLSANWAAPGSGEFSGITPFPGTQSPNPVTGPAGFAATTVKPGSYTLTETGSAPGFTNGTSFSCVVGNNAPVTVNAGQAIALSTGDAAVCTIVNTQINPTLTLVKAFSGATGNVADFPLSASAASGTQITGVISGTDDANNVPVTAGVQYTLSEMINAAGWAASGTWSCVTNGGSAVPGNTITLAAGAAATCTVTNTPIPVTPKIEKAVSSGPVQNADGSYTITYSVVVTQPATDPTTNPLGVSSVYEARDLLRFGTGFKVTGVVVNGTARNPVPTGEFELGNGTLAAGASATYTVAVTATIEANVISSDAANCVLDGNESGTGFLNEARVYVNNTKVDDDDACATPTNPGITKSNVSSIYDANTDLWTVSYDLAVANTGSNNNYYSLTDTPAFSSNVQGTPVVTPQGSTPALPAAVGWAGGVLTVIAPANVVNIPAATTHTYRVSFVVDTAGWASDKLECSLTGGKTGFFNEATLTVGNDTKTDDACAPVTERVGPSMTKSISSFAQGTDGVWEIVYNVVVKQPGGDANPDGLSARYSLVDDLRFGGDIAIVSAAWTGPGAASGSWADPDWTDEETLATNAVILAGATHTYTVTVRANVDAEAFEDTTLVCVDAVSGEAGGFLNVATMTVVGGGAPIVDDACDEPAAPAIEKTGTTTAGAGASTVVTYTIEVTNPSLTLPLQVKVSDNLPAVPTGWTLTGNAWTITAVGTTPIANPVPGGTPNTDVIIYSGSIPADTTYTYTVTGTLTPTNSASPIQCGPGTTPGTGLVNTATVESGAFEADDSDCVSIPLGAVEVDKADGVVTQLADGTWQIDYAIKVTNTSNVTTVYTLTDAPDFGNGWAVLSQGWVGTPPVADTTIAPAGVDTYTYRVTAEIAEDFDGDLSRVCDGEDGGEAFYNVASVAFPGGTDVDPGCAQPASPVVAKKALDATQDGTTGIWTLSYEVTVTNPATFDLAYTVTDDVAALPTGVTAVTPWVATGPAIAGGGTGTLTAGWAGLGELATGHFPAKAQHVYTVSSTVSIAADVDPTDLVCSETSDGDATGIWNTATVTNGVGGNDAEDCIEIDVPDADITKTVTSTTQLEDGTWEITYDIVVTNSSEELAAVYNLTDTLEFGGDILVNEASWSGEGDGDDFVGGTATIATNKVLPADGEHTYTAVVNATVPVDAYTPGNLSCDAEDPDSRGFLNTALLTVAGDEKPAEDCSEPSLPTIFKQGVSALQTADPDVWAVSYTITVDAGESDTYYTLSDTPDFAVGVDLGAGTAQRDDIDGEPVFDIEPGDEFPTEPMAIAAGATHTWTVTWLATIDAPLDPDVMECGEVPTAGQGFYNSVELLQGGEPVVDDEDCIPVIEQVYPTITKTATSVTQGDDGLWTITYDINVNLVDEDLAAKYSLTDTLSFGGDIAIVSKKWEGQGTTDGAFSGNTATIATDKVIGTGETHTYTVTVVANVTAAAIEGGTTVCESGEGGSTGGFLNTAELTSGGQKTPAEDCAEPVTPSVSKVGQTATQNEDGTWEISYLVTAELPSELPALAPESVTYSLTDTPTLPSGTALVAGTTWVASAADDDTPAPSQATWNGSGTWSLVSGGALTPENATHTYRVSAKVQVSSVPTGGIGECEDVDDSGIVVWNNVELKSGNHVVDDDACTVVHLDDVGIVKTTNNLPEVGSVEPGDVFDYVLTVTNYGSRAAEDVRVLDESINDRLQINGLAVTPASVTWGDAPGYTGNVVDLTLDSLPVGGSAEIVVTVEFLPAEAPAVEHLPPSADKPVAAEPLELLENTACVEMEGDSNPDNNCDDAEVPTRDMTVVVFSTCIADAPLLGWNVRKSSLLIDQPTTVLWTPNEAVATTDPASITVTDPAGSANWSNVIDWPGIAFTPSGISVDWPGWRTITSADMTADGTGYYLPGTSTVMTAEQQAEFVFNGKILDPSEIDFAWRGLTTVNVSVNPEQSFTVAYPPAIDDCAAERHAEVEIEKTASVKRTDPGKSFTYDISVKNVSDVAAADGVVVTDQIPAQLKVTDVTWTGKGNDSVFANWASCTISGQDANGYGGLLTCKLRGPLQPTSTTDGAWAAPTITLAVTVNPEAKPALVKNTAVVDYHTFGNPEDAGQDDDSVTVSISMLPPTGLVISGGLMGLVGLLLVGGALLMRRKREEAELVSEEA